MFCQSESIDKILICEVCEQKMVDPRVLPCGKSLCNRCVYDVSDMQKNKVKCQQCAKTHEIPAAGGFPKVLVLQKMLEIKANDVLQSKKIGEFKLLVQALNSLAVNIKLDLEIGDAKIRDQCDQIRNDIQLAIEQAHAKLDEIHEDFMHEIDNHEKDCQEKFKLIQQNKGEFDEVLNESNDFIRKSHQLFKQFQINETELTTSLDRAVHLLANLETTNENLEREMSNQSLLKFEKKNFDSNSLGEIKRQNIELYFLEHRETMREIDFRSKLDFTALSFLRPFDYNKFILLYSKNSSLNVVCVDREGNSLFEKKDLSPSKKIEDFKSVVFVSSTSRISFIYTKEKHFGREDLIFNLRSFDANFNLLAKIKLVVEPVSLELDSDSLFLLNKNENENFHTISIYNYRLEMLKKIGQDNRLLPFFLTPEIDIFLISNQFFIVNEQLEKDTKIKIINRLNGLVESFFVILDYFHFIRLYLDKYLITFNRETRVLKSYTFKGQLLSVVTLDERVGFSFFTTLNKELCFKTIEEKVFFI
jgi:hypothetical protein